MYIAFELDAYDISGLFTRDCRSTPESGQCCLYIHSPLSLMNEVITASRCDAASVWRHCCCCMLLMSTHSVNVITLLHISSTLSLATISTCNNHVVLLVITGQAFVSLALISPFLHVRRIRGTEFQINYWQYASDLASAIHYVRQCVSVKGSFLCNLAPNSAVFGFFVTPQT